MLWTLHYTLDIGNKFTSYDNPMNWLLLLVFEIILLTLEIHYTKCTLSFICSIENVMLRYESNILRIPVCNRILWISPRVISSNEG